MRYNKVSEKKQKLIDDLLNEPFSVGEIVRVKLNNYAEYRKILEIDENGRILVYRYPNTSATKEWISKENYEKDTLHTGANPFSETFWLDKIQKVNFTLESIIFMINERERKYSFGEVPNLNWNPYVTDKEGNKQYYQRDLVWTLKDKQLLIESIYKHIDCGKIVVRLNGFEKVKKNWKEDDKTMCWMDIIDGKQRLSAILEFLDGGYPDLHGNYYADLSYRAQIDFLDHQLFTFCELREDATDEDVLRTFLMVNFAGKPMSQEHLDYVKEIFEKNYK